ncbi:MAG: hypothetical protein AAGB15_03050 [Pseudomonadota bacterium]
MGFFVQRSTKHVILGCTFLFAIVAITAEPLIPIRVEKVKLASAETVVRRVTTDYRLYLPDGRHLWLDASGRLRVVPDGMHIGAAFCVKEHKKLFTRRSILTAVHPRECALPPG